MKYSRLVIAAALAASGIAFAAEDRAPADDHYVDDKVDCISDFIASELDASKHDSYIEECMQAKVAKRQQQAQAVKKG